MTHLLKGIHVGEEFYYSKNTDLHRIGPLGQFGLVVAMSIYGRTCLDGYLTNKLGIFALLYDYIVDYSTTFEVL